MLVASPTKHCKVSKQSVTKILQKGALHGLQPHRSNLQIRERDLLALDRRRWLGTGSRDAIGGYSAYCTFAGGTGYIHCVTSKTEQRFDTLDDAKRYGTGLTPNEAFALSEGTRLDANAITSTQYRLSTRQRKVSKSSIAKNHQGSRGTALNSSKDSLPNSAANFVLLNDRRGRGLFIVVVENTHRSAIKQSRHASCFTITNVQKCALNWCFGGCEATLLWGRDDVPCGTWLRCRQSTVIGKTSLLYFTVEQFRKRRRSGRYSTRRCKRIRRFTFKYLESESAMLKRSLEHAFTLAGMADGRFLCGVRGESTSCYRT